ncbi:uncharacterized protein LOC122042761 [Zingiber officinale]|uniref:DUF7815 domain-containing protein n=1 Tax=Zingiber officinale TaxID=94328 RepID=A0A8J5HRR1_ZINOF|nr:uncharacterized protein LOC122042761 [Zingiber officinale]KAG6529823.1 hypothetical protein ZIOFF_012037 [Zingiber officinale]
MVFEIPSARIQQLQEGLRREAGLSSNEPADSAPQLPSIRDAVAALDPELSPSLRCERCRGGLLRGLQSTICIYCGHDRRKEGSSHSISFNSTVGCRKLLDFLGLDGSETVLPDMETSGSKKGQDTPKSELVLSDLLDLVLKWPSDKEDIDDTSGSPVPNTIALTLTGVDLDNLFPERKGEASSIAPDLNDDFIPRQNREAKTHVSSAFEAFNVFGKLQTSEMKTSTYSSNVDGSFSAWNAEFHPASGTSAVSPKSLELFQDSSVSSLPNAAITEATKDQHEKIGALGGIQSQSGPPTSVNKELQNDFWPMVSAKIEPSNSLKDETHIDKGDSVIKSISGFSVQDDLWPSSSITKSDTSTQNNLTDDSIEDWQDFTGSARRTSSSMQNRTVMNLFGDSPTTKSDYLFPESSENALQSNKTVVGKSDSVDDWQDFASLGQQESSIAHRTQSDIALNKSVTPMHISSNTRSDSLINMDVGHDDSSDVWQDFSSSGAAVEDAIYQEAQNRILQVKDPLKTDAVSSLPTSSTKDLDKSKPFHGDDDSNDWQDFASFAEVPAKSLIVESQSNSTFLDLTPETKSIDTWPLQEKESTNGYDDEFDDWQDFTSSVEVRESSSDHGEQSIVPVFVHPSETNSIHHQGMKTDDAVEIQKHHSDASNRQLDVLTFDRTNEVDKKTALDPHSILWNGNENIGSLDANSNSEHAKSNVEMLVSQMHDLSFMLADELSIPEKHKKN